MSNMCGGDSMNFNESAILTDAIAILYGAVAVVEGRPDAAEERISSALAALDTLRDDAL